MDNIITISSIDSIENQFLSILKEGDITNAQLTLIRFQLKAIASLKESTLTLSFVDSLINYLNISEIDENHHKPIKHQAHILISSVIFFHQSSLEYEKATLKKTSEQILKRQYDIYKESIVAVGNSLELMLKLIFSTTIIKIDKKKLDESIFQIKDKAYSAIDKIIDYFRDQKILKKRYDEILRRENELHKNIPVIIDKLHQNFEALGKSVLITGLIENHRRILISEPIQQIIKDTERPEKRKSHFNNPFKKLNNFIFGIGICMVIICLLLSITYLISLIFSDGTYIKHWIRTIWNFKYILLIFLVLSYVVTSFVWFLMYNKHKKLNIVYEQEFVKDQREYFSKIEKQTKRIYDKYNMIYKNFHPYNKELPISYDEETFDFKERMNS